MSQQNPIPDAAPVQVAAQNQKFIDIVFDGPPGPESGRFVEVEDEAGKSIDFGQWVHRPDGFWVLRILYPSVMLELVSALKQCQRYIDNCTYIETKKTLVLWPHIDEILGRLEGGAP